MNTVFSRLYQKSLYGASFLMKWKEPELLYGPDALLGLADFLYAHNYKRVLLVTDMGIIEAGLLHRLNNSLGAASIDYAVFQDVTTNPTVQSIEELAIAFKDFNADVMVAVGGGSVIDAAKAAGIIIGKPEKPLKAFKGLLKVRHSLPPLIAVPTTAGTGSEATVAAVVSDPEHKEKFTIMDPTLIPDCAILDPRLLTSLPKELTAETGMDALTHLVEAYIGKSNTKETRQLCQEALQLISSNLLRSYFDGEDIEARANMLQASYKAGRAFTRAYVGNVHALSHALTAYYSLPHGQTNALLLPDVLAYYGPAVYRSLAELSDVLALTEAESPDSIKAEAFISWIRTLNSRLGLPPSITGIQSADIPKLARHAAEEANPLYPVPVIFSEKDFTTLLLSSSPHSVST